MPVENDTDRLTMVDDWDEAVINGRKVRGIFSNEYLDASGVQSRTPNFTCRSVDVRYIEGGQLAIINNNSYKVRVPDYDPTAEFVTLIFERQQ